MTTITMNAFIKRLGRNLARDGLTLKTARGDTASLGPFYTVNENNVVEHQGLTWDVLQQWGEEVRLLKAGESVAA